MLGFEPDRPHVGASLAWGHMVGAVSVPTAGPAPAPADRAEILELLSRYCWGLDERRADVLGECMTADCCWEGSASGSHRLGPVGGREEILAWIAASWSAESGQPRHMLLNTVFSAASEHRAETCSYFLFLRSAQNRTNLIAPGFVRVGHRRDRGRWAIEEIFQGFDNPPWGGDVDSLTAAQRRRFALGPVE